MVLTVRIKTPILVNRSKCIGIRKDAVMTYLKVPSQYLPPKTWGTARLTSTTEAANPSEGRTACPPHRRGTAYTDQCQGAGRLQAAETLDGTGNAPCLQIISYLSTIVQLSHPTSMWRRFRRRRQSSVIVLRREIRAEVVWMAMLDASTDPCAASQRHGLLQKYRRTSNCACAIRVC